MNLCLQEGDWRAYIDGELPADEMVRAREHLAECAACRDLHQEISARAARVSVLLSGLQPAAPLKAPAAARRRTWKGVAAGLGLAAALAAAFVLMPSRVQTVQAPSVIPGPPEVAKVQPAIPPAPAIAAAPAPAAPRRVARRRVSLRPQPAPQYYLALDDQPIETGTVMRVAFESGRQADVIVDSDGRPRAIRAVQ